jgi:hypothetical protein
MMVFAYSIISDSLNKFSSGRKATAA